MSEEMPTVDVYGSPGSTEYQAALLLRDLIRNAAGPEDHGGVAIHTDLYFPGQKREQIDLLLHAYFPKGLSRRLRIDGADREIVFKDIVAVIEVKAHHRENVLFSGTNAEVLYNGVWKSASSQSHEQVYSAKPFFDQELGWSPYVCNLIFFTNLSETDLPSGPRNYLAGDSSFSDLLESLCVSRRLTAFYGRGRSAIFSCLPGGSEEEWLLKNDELERLLRSERAETIRHVRVSPFYPRTQYWQTPFLSPPLYKRIWRYPRRPRVSLSKTLVAVMLFGWLILAAVHIVSRTLTMASHHSPSVPPATLRTCVRVTSSCSCLEGKEFRRAATVAIQFKGIDQRPISGAVYEPDRQTIPLHFREVKMSSSYSRGHCFVAMHQFPRDAPAGSYFVQLSLGSMDGQPAGAVSKRFQIEP